VDHLFRHEAGKMVSVLTRIFGVHNLEMAEDVVQEAFLKAAQTWQYNAVPENPSAWLMLVAKNKALDIIRRKQHFDQLSAELVSQLQKETANTLEYFFLDTEIADSQLRMIFACCHPSLKPEDQIALTLKTISGFGVAEIAKALVTNETVVQKRLYRAKQFIKTNNISFEIPAGNELLQRLERVYMVLYLLFNEGYNSLKSDELIRKDVCAEAMRLCLLLSEHAMGKQPATFALLSLMCFHASRFDSRLDENNAIILLQHQDREKWDKGLIGRGHYYLDLSAAGNYLSVYHIEAAIAGEYSLSSSFETTNWARLLQLYDMLLEKKQMPVVFLNRAIVLSQMNDTKQAIQEILSIAGIEKILAAQYIYNAVLGDMYMKINDTQKAMEYLSKAKVLTTSLAEKKLIAEKIKTMSTEGYLGI
jgi:RNA polymerase sigma factor (sigma-70 family)